MHQKSIIEERQEYHKSRKQSQNYQNKQQLSKKYEQLSQQEIQSDIQQFQPTCMMKFFFAYLYFVQGLILAIGATMPYIYPKLPSYSVMAVFNTISISFSFKWISAPFIQKYTSLNYGRRKTWIIISQFLTAIFLFIASFYTDFEHSYTMAFFLLFSNLFVSFQDISLDSLAIKQLKVPHITTMISTIYQSFGIIFGSMLLLKLTSTQFSKFFDRSQAFTDANTILKMLSLLILIPTIFIHFIFEETTLQQQKQVGGKSFWQVICQYGIFFKGKSKYFRTVIILLINQQGFNFFMAGYDYQLVKAGFSRDTNNTLQNIIVIPVSFLACCLASKIEPYGMARSMVTSQLILMVVYLYLRIFFPLNVHIVIITNFISSFCTQWMFMTTVLMNNSFPVSALSGMFLTFLASSNNLGRQTGLHTKVLDIFGWWTMAYIGLGIQLIITLLLSRVFEWKDRGTQDIAEIMKSSQQIQQSNNSNKLFKRYPRLDELYRNF